MFCIVRVHFRVHIFPSINYPFQFLGRCCIGARTACSSKICSGIGNVIAARVQLTNPVSVFSVRAREFTRRLHVAHSQ